MFYRVSMQFWTAVAIAACDRLVVALAQRLGGSLICMHVVVWQQALSKFFLQGSVSP